MKEGYVNIPKPFFGTEIERNRNIATHHWMRVGEDEIRCGECECRYFGGVSFWPCGKEERIEVRRGSRYAKQAIKHTILALGYAAQVRANVENNEEEMSDGE